MEELKMCAAILPGTTPKITFGCPTLDRKFGGGIPLGSLTEITGESGCGKTQIMLQLALNAQLSKLLGGQEGQSLFLNTELAFPMKRLQQIAENNPFLESNSLDKVFVRSVESVDDLLSILAGLESFLAKNNLKLILLDSFTTLFRGQFANTGHDMTKRQGIFFSIASKLKLFAHRYNLAVVLSNQVVDMVEGFNHIRVGNDSSLTSSGRAVIPALGLSWASCVNTRFVILKHEECEHVVAECGTSSKTAQKKTKRILKVVFAPHIGEVAWEIDINSDGVFGVN